MMLEGVKAHCVLGRNKASSWHHSLWKLKIPKCFLWKELLVVRQWDGGKAPFLIAPSTLEVLEVTSIWLEPKNETDTIMPGAKTVACSGASSLINLTLSQQGVRSRSGWLVGLHFIFSHCFKKNEEWCQGSNFKQLSNRAGLEMAVKHGGRYTTAETCLWNWCFKEWKEMLSSILPAPLQTYAASASL